MTPTVLFLISILLKVTVLLSLAALLALAFRRASAATRHALWTSALGAALVVSALAFVVPQWQVVTVPMTIAPETQSQAPHLVWEKPIVVEQPAPNGSGTERVIARNARKVQPPAAAPSIAAAPQLTPATADPIPPRPIRWQPLIAVLWLAGCLLVLTRYLLNALRLHRAQRACRAITSGPLAERLRELQQHLGISRPVTLVESDAIEVPMTWGVVYPRVLLPKAASEWTAARRDAVLQHELAHVKRCDALTQWLAYFACAMYWFHPLVWFAARQMRAERERACDDVVLHAGVPASAYATDLLEIVSTFRSHTELYPAALAMARRSQFEGRLMALLNPQAKRSSFSRRQLLVTLLFTFLVTIPLAALAARGADYRAAMGLSPQADEQAAATDLEAAGKTGATGGAQAGVKDGVPGGVPGGVQGGVAGGVYTYSTPRDSQGGVYTYTTPGEPQAVGKPAPDGKSYSYLNQYGAQPIPASFLPQAARGAVPPDLLTGCTHGKDSSSSHRSESDGTSRRAKISWEGSDCSIDMRAEGKYTFNADFTAFATIGSFVEIKTDIRGDKTELNIRPGSNGLQYQFFRNRQETPYAQGGAEFLAKFLLTADRLFAIGIDARFPKLVQEGGPNRVLAEVGVMGNDYARATYMLRLVETVPLNPEQLRGTLVIDQGLGSDYEKARVLVAVAKKYDLNDAGVREAFLGAANGMSSDYEHARSLLAFFDKSSDATPAQLNAILTSVPRMSSDYEKARVLMAISSRYDLSAPGLRDAFLAATKTLSSDYEHARSLLAFFEKGAATPAQTDAILTSVTRMSSDYERGRVLLKLNEGTKLDPSARLRFIAAADGMQSDYEKGRVLKSAIAVQDTDDAAALAIILCTRRMSSDNERSGVLQKLAKSRSLEGKLRDAFVDAARAMGSDYERNKALAAIGMGPDTSRTTL